MSSISQHWYNAISTYVDDSSLNSIFFKVKDQFGGFSNMSNDFGLCVNGHQIANSEALYQACRFPDHPEIQREIIAQKSGLAAKMKSKKYRNDFTREDWDEVRVDIMRYCVQLKLAQNETGFGTLLESTNGTVIVERSSKDNYWGAVWDENAGAYVGHNVLGKILTEARLAYTSRNISISNSGGFGYNFVTPVTFGNFKLFGVDI